MHSDEPSLEAPSVEARKCQEMGYLLDNIYDATDVDNVGWVDASRQPSASQGTSQKICENYIVQTRVTRGGNYFRAPWICA